VTQRIGLVSEVLARNGVLSREVAGEFERPVILFSGGTDFVVNS
jgi:3'-phosphoadenosine 5'-phosphosulfate sulfotransferase (PAPS reductase)/FAD synthetase